METDFLSAFGAGSGINTTEVVSALVAAEREPAQMSLDRKKGRADLSISAFGVVKATLAELKSSFEQLNDVRDLVDNAVTNSNPTAISVEATGRASTGSYNIYVDQLAQATSYVTNGFVASDSQINSGASLDITFTTSSDSFAVTITDPTPENIVQAVNDAGLDQSAKLLNTGDATNPYVILFEGISGADAGFTISISSDQEVADLSIASQVQSARDSSFNVNGVQVTRSSNTITDLFDGVTLSLEQTFASAATINIARSTDTAKSALENMVTMYNSSVELFNELSSLEKSDDELVGSLSSNSTFRSITSAIRRVITSDSSTATSDVRHFTDMGISLNREGFLEIDDARLTEVLNDNFDDVVTALTADTNDQTNYGDFDRGIAGDMTALIENLLKTTGSVSTAIQSASDKLSTYEDDLASLDTRMEQIKERYLTQFTAMQRIVDQMQSTGDYLKNQFDAMNNKS